MMKTGFPKCRRSESDINDSENPSDYGFRKTTGQIPTTTGFKLKLQHIPRINYKAYIILKLTIYKIRQDFQADFQKNTHYNISATLWVI